jgi:hypothetical protein
MMGVFSVPAVGALFIGLFASKFANWKRDGGIVLLSASPFTTLLVLTVVCMVFTPEIHEVFPENELVFFSDYVSGVGCLTFFRAAGRISLVASRTGQSIGRLLTARLDGQSFQYRITFPDCPESIASNAWRYSV